MSYYTGKNIIVTGGAGFIGSHLCDGLFAAGANQVAVVDNFFLGKEENLIDAQQKYGEKLVIYREDAGEFAAMKAVCDAEQPDIVFNLATKALLYSFFNPAGAYEVNTKIALSLLEILRFGGMGRLVHFSTSEVFGSAQYVPMDENHPLLAETTYAAGKAAADLAVDSYVRMFGLDAFIVRPFNNYGPRQNDKALAAIIPLTLRRIMAGEAPLIQGTGEQTRDFIYVKDTIQSLLKLTAIDGLKGQSFNLGSGRETSIKEILDTLCELMDFKAPYIQKPTRVADVMRHWAGVDKARGLIGDVAPTLLLDGLKDTVDWYVGDSK